MKQQPAPTVASLTHARGVFAKHVHAEAHAVVALQDLRRQLDRGLSRAALYQHIDDEIVRRCQRCNLEPDLMSDALEAVADDIAIAAGGVA